MAKNRTFFTCQNCGSQSPKWLGKCPDCAAWNTFVEEQAAATPTRAESARGLGRGEAVVVSLDSDLSEIELPTPVSTGFQEFDRVLGGGIIPGSFTLIGGDPGIGKSTLMLQTVSNLAAKGQEVLYVSGEESVAQTQLRAKRLGASGKNIKLASETNLETILSICKKTKPFLVVIDSIQTAFLPDLQSAPGSVTQVRECASKLMYLAKTEGISVLLVGHITKDGSIAGPKVLEHMVDTVLSFEGDRDYFYRLLRSVKNRFGPAQELGVFEMVNEGLREVSNPSELFLSADRKEAVSGSSVFATIEGTRPYLVEVQALATSTNMAMPRRTSLGVDANRVHLILAILDKHLKLNLYAHDIFVNVVGGFKVGEPAVDLALASAILSSLHDVPTPERTIFIGELGLTGEVRPVSFPELRVKEATKLGFKKFILPEASRKYFKKSESTANVQFVGHVRELEKLVSR